MGHINTWLHDHHLGVVARRETDLKIVLLVTLVAVVFSVALVLLFPSATH